MSRTCGGAEVSSGARRRLSVRGARGGGCPRPYQRVGAPFGRVFFSTSRRFFPPRREPHCAAARNRMAAGLRRAGSPGGEGRVWARAAKTGRKCSAGRRGFADCYLAFEMGAALVEIPLGFSTCGEIWLCLDSMSPPRPAGALQLPFFELEAAHFSHTKSLAAAEVPRRPQRLPRLVLYASARVLNAPRH